MSEDYSTSVKIQIRKPPSVVFEGIVDPKNMTNYWISESNGRLVQYTKVTWKFSEFNDPFNADVKKIEKNSYVSFTWFADGNEDLVEMKLEPFGEGDTKVTITERRLDEEPMNVLWVRGSTVAGQTSLLASKPT